MVNRLITVTIVTASVIVGAWAVLTAPSGPRVVEFHGSTVDATIAPAAVAEERVEQQERDLTAGLTCYDDPTGEEPSTAVVKDDGGVTAYRLTAEQAWDAAHAGTVWVLAWCD